MDSAEVLFLVKVMPKFSGDHAYWGGSNSPALCTAQATMVRTMSEGIMARYLKSAMADMIRNNMTEIRCPCRRCKLRSWIKPDSGLLESHLLVRGFMDGYTRWI